MDTGPGRVDALNFVCGAMKLFSANDGLCIKDVDQSRFACLARKHEVKNMK